MPESVGTPAAVVRRAACNTPAHLQVLVCQLGAREHYLVARCFAKQGSLSCLATDFWSPIRRPQSRVFRRLPKVMLSALARRHDDVPAHQVASFPLLSAARYGIGLFDHKGAYGGTAARRFARGVEALRVPHNIFFGYSYDSLELLREERERGVFTVLCQTDPGPAHYKMLSEEAKKWPEYDASNGRWWTERRADRLRQEWELADVVVVNSEWTRESIIAEGAEPSKIEILPLAYEAPKCEMLKYAGEKGPLSACQHVSMSAFAQEGSAFQRLSVSASSPLHVLWLGNVALGKGIQYLVEAARLLVNEQVEFTVAGSIRISPASVKAAPKNMRWLGQIPRSATAQLYRDCDLFVFPTLSDGFGLTQLEALTQGVPVITTANCGRVVEEGLTGFIVPARDAPALADAILRFVRNQRLAQEMSQNCLKAAKAFSVDRYGHRLREIINRSLAQRGVAER